MYNDPTPAAGGLVDLAYNGFPNGRIYQADR